MLIIKIRTYTMNLIICKLPQKMFLCIKGLKLKVTSLQILRKQTLNVMRTNI